MSPEEKQEFTRMQTDIKEIKSQLGGFSTQMATFGSQMSECLLALRGSAISEDGGLVLRIKLLEQKNKEQDEKLEEMKRNAMKADLYLKMLWGTGASLATLILTYIVNKFLH